MSNWPSDTTPSTSAVYATGGWRPRLVAAWFLAVLVIPGLALVAGVRPQNIENRSLAKLPAVSAGALLSTSFYAGVDQFLTDNFPLRESATSAFAALGYGVLNDSPSSQVIVGKDDWLFFHDELVPTCRRTGTALATQVTALAAKLSAKNRRLAYIIAPDKHAIYPDKIGPAARIGVPCSDTQRPDMIDAAAANPSIIGDLWTPLSTARHDKPGTLLYWRADTHWTPSGAIVGVRATVDLLAPGLWDPKEVRIGGTVNRIGELTRLMGIVRNEPVPGIQVRRAVRINDTVLDYGHYRHGEDIHEYVVTGPDAVVPGTTVFVFDSFFDIDRALIIPWFQRSIWIHVTDLTNHPELARYVDHYDNLVYETVERGAYSRGLTSILQPLLDR